jgi:hypothetical protein
LAGGEVFFELVLFTVEDFNGHGAFEGTSRR